MQAAIQTTQSKIIRLPQSIRSRNLQSSRSHIFGLSHYEFIKGEYAESAVEGTALKTSGGYVVRHSSFLERVHNLLEINMDNEHYCIDRLCRDAGVSRSNLHKKLKALTGMSTSIYVRMIKLRKAQELLLQSDMNITQVAFATGFSDPTYFTRVFRQSFDLSPRDYRRTAVTSSIRTLVHYSAI